MCTKRHEQEYPFSVWNGILFRLNGSHRYLSANSILPVYFQNLQQTTLQSISMQVNELQVRGGLIVFVMEWVNVVGLHALRRTQVFLFCFAFVFYLDISTFQLKSIVFPSFVIATVFLLLWHCQEEFYLPNSLSTKLSFLNLSVKPEHSHIFSYIYDIYMSYICILVSTCCFNFFMRSHLLSWHVPMMPHSCLLQLWNSLK
jgi:hypothetical protein